MTTLDDAVVCEAFEERFEAEHRAAVDRAGRRALGQTAKAFGLSAELVKHIVAKVYEEQSFRRQQEREQELALAFADEPLPDRFREPLPGEPLPNIANNTRKEQK